MTERLYYIDSHIKNFSAVVQGCEKAADGYRVILNRTAFFPEGGGQSGDRGTLGGVTVFDTHEKSDEVIHYTDDQLTVGETVQGELDWAFRFQNMQSHTGEHILSGLVHSLYGFENVGFHAGSDGVIVDFDGFLTPEELVGLELRANEIIWQNKAITTYFPTTDELSKMTYRSKLNLTENVRIVEIEDCDVCACCATHVKSTGEIGLIKILESIKRKDGVRLRMLAGKNAFSDYREKSGSVSKVSSLLSAKQSEIAPAVEHLLAEKDELSYEFGGIIRELIALKAGTIRHTEGNLIFFEPLFSSDALRMLVNATLPLCDGICGAFSGDDTSGYRYILASNRQNLRTSAAEINNAIDGRGGGTEKMIQGTAKACRESIERYFGV